MGIAGRRRLASSQRTCKSIAKGGLENWVKHEISKTEV